MSVNYYRHIPLLDHVVRARYCHIRKNFELSDIGQGFAIIVNDGMLSGLSLGRGLNSVYWPGHQIVLWACLVDNNSLKRKSSRSD